MSDAVLIAIVKAIGDGFASLGPLVAAIFAGLAVYQSRQTHKLVNSRMDEFIRSETLRSAQGATIARAEGVAAGEQSQRDRDMVPIAPPLAPNGGAPVTVKFDDPQDVHVVDPPTK